MAVDNTLPKQLQVELEAAEALQAQINGTAPTGNTEQQTEPVSTDAETTKPTVETPPTAKPVDAFEAKYKVLEGKYRKEVPELSGKLKQLEQTLQDVLLENKELKDAKSKQPEPKEDPLVTSKDEEAFGADLIDLSRRVVREEITAVLKRLTTIERAVAAAAQIGEKVNRIEEVNAQTAEERFWADVSRLVPDWAEVDEDIRWVEFLDTRARGSAKTYRQQAIDAISAGNAEAISELVSLWKDTSGITQQQVKKDQRERELASQAQPGKSKAGAQTAPVGDEVYWTWEQYQNVFSPNINREYTPAQVSKLQADAEKAYLEGRIRN